MSNDAFKSNTYEERIEALRNKKLFHTEEKRQILGSMDFDDLSMILPAPESRKIIKTISGSGIEITDCLLKEFEPIPNHSNGGFYGPKSVGENFRRLLEIHPTYIDPMSSIACAYMVVLQSYRTIFWNPDYDFSHLQKDIDFYKLWPGIGAVQHFCQDLKIGFELGFGGILNKIRQYKSINLSQESQEFYDGLESVVLGVQNWISRHSDDAKMMAEKEVNPQLKENLLKISEISKKLISEPPDTFREAVQWMSYFQVTGKMYNMNGSLGRIDVLLYPYYEKDIKAGILTDEEAVFHLACHLVRDTSYIQLGGPDENGKDVTNKLSYLMLQAAHLLKIPANIGVCVAEYVDPNLLKTGVEMMFEDKTGIPKFLGVENTARGFAKNGFPMDIAWQRAYSGCHWSALPGMEYTVNDCVKINLAKVFEIALNDMMETKSSEPKTDLLLAYFEKHLRKSADVTKESLDFHIEHMHKVYPELVLDLLCYDTIERGIDASHGGVKYLNLCVDGSGLAVVADSFAALEQRIDKEKRMSWEEIKLHLDNNWSGTDGEKARLIMKTVPKYGHGNTIADSYAVKISKLFTTIIKEKPTPKGHNLIPGLFSWAMQLTLGEVVGATPNGRYAKAPITHGSNPEPGFRKDGAPTALSNAIASIQSGYGNACPMQLELDPGVGKDEGGLEKVTNLIKTHFDLGGTQINLNILDKKKIIEAHKDPSKYPDLVVRVTGFSAYFASLSPEFRQLVVDRIIAEND